MSLLEENGADFTTVEYLKTPLNKDEILSLSKKLGLLILFNEPHLISKLVVYFLNTGTESGVSAELFKIISAAFSAIISVVA